MIQLTKIARLTVLLVLFLFFYNNNLLQFSTTTVSANAPNNSKRAHKSEANIKVENRSTRIKTVLTKDEYLIENQKS